MNSNLEFIIGETYRYINSGVDYTCVAFDLKGAAVLQRTDGRDSAFSVATASNYHPAPKPPVVIKKFYNVYNGAIGNTGFSTLDAARKADTMTAPLAQLEYTYTDGVVTDVAFIKQIGT